MPTDTKLRGSSGEHLVCGILAQFDWAAALTREGVARTDILAVHAVTGKTITIQVKTNWCNVGERAKWRLGLKDILPAIESTEWYVMVKLEAPAPAAARYFVVPRDHVAAGAWIGHQSWLLDPAAPPGTRNTPQGQCLAGEKVFKDYEGGWDLLGTATNEVPVMLPRDYKAMCRELPVPLPEDHPWRDQLPSTGNWSDE